MNNLIFIHGLNNNDHMWDEFIPLFEHQFKIHKIRLLGQEGNYQKLFTLTKDELLSDLETKLANISGPKYIISYSMGAVSLSHILNEVQDVRKIVYLAPAFKVRMKIILKLALKFPKSMELKSIPPEKYMLYTKLPLNVYQVLMELGESLKESMLPKKALIFCSKTDLLVSYHFIHHLKDHFPDWELIDLNRKVTDLHPAFQHMIFSEKYLGLLWPSMISKIQNYFKDI